MSRPLAVLDPESVSDDQPTRLVTTPRAVFGFHALVAAVLVGFGVLLTRQGSAAGGAIVTLMSGMVVVAGWAAGRVVARR